MRRVVCVSLAAGLVIGAASGVSGEQSEFPKARANPFSPLFLLSGQPGTGAPPAAVKKEPATTARARPWISCGMTMLPVDPAVDRSIRHPAPTSPKPKVRAMQAPPCETIKR
jgi:hypothetical protein